MRRLKELQQRARVTGSLAFDGDDADICHDCGGAGFFKVIGENNKQRLVPCENPIHEKDRWKRYKELSDIVSPAQLERTLDDIDVYHKGGASNKAALAAARAFTEKPRGWFYLYGTYGNAKTEIALALFNNLRVAHSRYGIYISMQSLVTFIYEAYSLSKDPESLTVSQRIDLFKRVPVLVVDEFDFDDTKINITSNVLQILFEILNDRYERAIHSGQVTIFTANQSPEESLPPALLDRMNDGRFVVVENTAPSKRQYMKWSDSV